MTKILILGASSGIGLSLAKYFLARGDSVAATARSTDAFEKLIKEYPETFCYRSADIRDRDNNEKACRDMIDRMGGLDTAVISAGVSLQNLSLSAEKEELTVNINVSGFVYAAIWLAHYFEHQGHGHLAATSSMAQFYGSPQRPSYNASKAFISTFMEGLAIKYHGSRIFISDIRPGLIDTPMTVGLGYDSLKIKSEKAALIIAKGLARRKRKIIIGKGWMLLARLSALLPLSLFRKIYYSASPKRS